MKLNERIKACRMRAGMTQEQVAEAMNVSRQAVTKWENGQSAPSTENLFRLAALFGTTVDMLLEKKAPSAGADRKVKVLRNTIFSTLWYGGILGICFLLRDIGVMKDTYLFSWQMSSGSLLTVYLVSLGMGVLCWDRVVASMAFSHLIGFVCGNIFGPNPERAALGFGHYGWAWWILFMLAGTIVGLVIEYRFSRKTRKNIENRS